MIDYYYEFPEHTRLFDQDMRYGFIANYHPENDSRTRQMLHNQCYIHAQRIWLENSNGAVLIRNNGRDVHERIHPKELTWVKLSARQLGPR